MLERIKEILINTINSKLIFLWSGGIDTTCIIVALLYVLEELE